MPSTLVALFETRAEAEAAAHNLVNNGFLEENVRLHCAEAAANPRWYVDDFRRMGVPDGELDSYGECLNHGGALLSVRTSDDNAPLAIEMLERSGAMDVDERLDAWRKRPAREIEVRDMRDTDGGREAEAGAAIPFRKEDASVRKMQEKRERRVVRRYVDVA